MYYQDSPLRTVSCFDFDINKGEISNRKEVISLPEGMGNPDGNTIDEDVIYGLLILVELVLVSGILILVKC